MLCIFALISALPLYSSAKDPDSGLAAPPQLFSAASPLTASSPSQLLSLLHKATHEHPQIKSQLQSLQATGLEVLVAEQSYWPTPSITLERAQTHSPDPAYAGSPQVLTFKLQQPLWTGGRLLAQTQKALATQAVERARLTEIQQTVALRTLQAWVEVVSAQHQQMVLRRSDAVQTQLLNKIERRVDQGLSSRSEASYSGMRLMQVQQELANAIQLEQQAWIRLKQWVPEVQVQTLASDMITAIPPNDLTQWTQRSLANSGWVQRLEHMAQLQLAELAEKRAALQPEVYVRAEHQRGNYTYANLPNVNRVFVGMTASTGAGLGLAHQLAALQSKHDATLEEIAVAQRGVTETLQTDFVNANARQSKAMALRLNLESSQEMQAAWERQFINGKKTWIDVMNAARETSQAELAVLENDMALLHSQWRLHIQVQGTAAWTAP